MVVLSEIEEQNRSDELSMDLSIPVDDEETVVDLATKENRAVQNLRIVLIVVLCLVAVAVSTSVFFYSRSLETDTFESSFGEQAGKVVDAFQANAERRLTALEAFAGQITSHSISAQESFPNVTLPDFERKAAYVRKQAGAVALMVFPLVSTEQRFGWEAYSVANQGWLTEGLAVQEAEKKQLNQGSNSSVTTEDEQAVNDLKQIFDDSDIVEGDETILESMQISPVIYRIIENTFEGERDPGPGPFAPIWTVSPAIPIPVMINLNTFSHPTRAKQLNAMLKDPSTLIAEAGDYRDDGPLTAGRKDVLNLFLNRWKEGEFDYEEGPVSDLYLPIWDSYGKERQMAAVLTAYVYWQSYLSDILPDTAKGILAVLENSCNQTFTYRIDGESAYYMDQGDLHDSKYDKLGVESDFGAFLRDNRVPIRDEDHGVRCHYKLRVYPTQETEDEYLTNQPLIFMVVLLCVFLFTSMVFILYDQLVARRHKVVNTTAVQSTKVVSSLFPEQVRNRLYDESDNNNANNNHKINMFHARREEPSESNALVNPSEVDDSMPIADLYQNCTVFFGDLAGFTSWSSQRTPTEVFKLLETLYGAFDKIAKRRHVFKIETIGDCYVAVTGLPKAQPDHAVIMTKFAADCMDKMNNVLHSLADQLGDETVNLAMRCGLHSGPVTAGVLRGDKARFQLFGDTVNTAARMESNGQRGRIHVSEATAELLKKGGKTDWVVQREQLIEAKGKGKMQTYWVEPRSGCGMTNTTSTAPELLAALPVRNQVESDPKCDCGMINTTATTAAELVPPALPVRNQIESEPKCVCGVTNTTVTTAAKLPLPVAASGRSDNADTTMEERLASYLSKGQLGGPERFL